MEGYNPYVESDDDEEESKPEIDKKEEPSWFETQQDPSEKPRDLFSIFRVDSKKEADSASSIIDKLIGGKAKDTQEIKASTISEVAEEVSGDSRPDTESELVQSSDGPNNNSDEVYTDIKHDNIDQPGDSLAEAKQPDRLGTETEEPTNTENQPASSSDQNIDVVKSEKIPVDHVSEAYEDKDLKLAPAPELIPTNQAPESRDNTTENAQPSIEDRHNEVATNLARESSPVDEPESETSNNENQPESADEPSKKSRKMNSGSSLAPRIESPASTDSKIIHEKDSSGAGLVGALLFGEWIGRRRADKGIKKTIEKNQKQSKNVEQVNREKLAHLAKNQAEQKATIDKKLEDSKNTEYLNNKTTKIDKDPSQKSLFIQKAELAVDEKLKTEQASDMHESGQPVDAPIDRASMGEVIAGNRLGSQKREAKSQLGQIEQSQYERNFIKSQESAIPVPAYGEELEINFDKRHELTNSAKVKDSIKTQTSPSQEPTPIGQVLAGRDLFRSDNYGEKTNPAPKITQTKSDDSFTSSIQAGIVIGLILISLTGIFLIFR